MPGGVGDAQAAGRGVGAGGGSAQAEARGNDRVELAQAGGRDGVGFRELLDAGDHHFSNPALASAPAARWMNVRYGYWCWVAVGWV